MASVFPGSLDNLETNKTNDTDQDTDHPNHHNTVADAINKIEAELGTAPSGSAADVKTRLNGMDTTIADSANNALDAALAADVGPITISVKTANYTLALGDEGTRIEVTSATAKTVTIPANATAAFAIGTIIEVAQGGAGAVTIAPAGGVSLTSPFGLTTAFQGSSVRLLKQSTNSWVVENGGSADTSVNQSIVDAKGDLLVGSAADTLIRKAVGAEGYVLTVSSAAAGGVTWTPGGGGGGGGPDLTQVYQEIITIGGRVTTAGVTGTVYTPNPINPEIGPTTPVSTGSAPAIPVLTMGTLDYVAPDGYKTVMRTRIRPAIGSAAPGCTITGGLYALTITGNAITFDSTRVTGSDCARGPLTTTQEFVSQSSNDFDMPSNGPYALGMVMSTQNPTAAFTYYMTLQVRFVPL